MRLIIALIAASLATLSVQHLQAQSCTPLNPFPAGQIIVPLPYTEADPGQGIQDTAFAGIPYSTDFHFNVPSTIVFNTTTLPVSSISLATTGAIQNLPASLSYTCNPPNCIFQADQPGCVNIFGVPGVSQIGVHDLLISATINSIFIIPVVLPSPGIVEGNYYLHVKNCPDYNLQQSDTVCSGESFTFPDGTVQVITENTTHVSTFLAANGCDSLVTTLVEVSVVDTGVGQDGNTLTASAAGSTFQWMDCNGNQPVADATGASFTPVATGSYAVIVDNGTCQDTSACFNVIINSADERGKDSDLILSPNPVVNTLHLALPALSEPALLSIRDINGRELLPQTTISTPGADVDVSALPAGFYFLSLQSKEIATTRSFFKK